MNGNANNTANAQSNASIQGNEDGQKVTTTEGFQHGKTPITDPQQMIRQYPHPVLEKENYSKSGVVGGPSAAAPLTSSTKTSSTSPGKNLGESTTTTTASSTSQQIMTSSLIGSTGGKSKRFEDSKDKFSFAATTNGSKTADQNLMDTLGNGEDTSTSTSKKPQFQFVCMEPTKDQKQERTVKTTNQPKADKTASLIDPATLSRILRLQKQQQFIIKSQTSAYGPGSSGYFGQSLNLIGGGSTSTVQRIIYSDKSNDISAYASGLTQLRERSIKLDIEKIGICGVPSLWVSRDELIGQGHILREQLDESERLERLLRILLCHKKYENDKYFGGSIFKRANHGGGVNQGFTNAIMNGGNMGGNMNGNQAQSTVSLGMGLGNQSEFIWFSLENLAKLKINAQTANQYDDKEGSAQIFPQIKSFDQAESLTFKILQAEAKLVRLILESHGFVQTEQNDWNIMWTCTSSMQKQYIYENLLEYQRINHFLNAAELTRKDRLCYNVGKMQQKFGKENFDFLPETYILPDEYAEFEKQFKIRAAQQRDQIAEGENSKNLWIVKPSSSSQGKGIYMIDDLSELQMNESQVISRYIDNPLLINGLKFDLRLYVLVTNFDPLKIYVYNEGLVRFASEPYNLETIKSNVYAHLTNYSINKKSENFVQNKNLTERDFGNKWSLSALQSHLERLGIDMKAVWQRIYDSIIKSIISVEGQVVGAIKRVQNASGGSIKSNCFDLFGFDIILDQDLKPWILEVNLSPSLAFDSPLDFHIKSNLIIDALNIVGIKKYNRNKDGKRGAPNGGPKPVKLIQANSGQANQQTNNQGSAQKTDPQADQRKRLSAHSSTLANMQSQSQLAKFDSHSLEKNHSNHQTSSNLFQNVNIDIIHMERLSKISAKHRELLREHLEEFCLMRQFVNIPGSQAKARRHNFTRIFPAPGTNAYEVFFSSEQAGQTQPQKQYNKILYRYLYDKSSELQDILNQIVRQYDLQNESQRRASQTRVNAQQNALKTRDQLSDSLERIERGEFYDKSPERIMMGSHAQGTSNSAVADGSQGNHQTITSSQTKVVVTSVSVEQANATQIGFNKQPRSQSSIAATQNGKNDNDNENFNSVASPNLKTIVVNNSSQLSTFSPNKDQRRAVGVLQASLQIENSNLATSPTKVKDYFSSSTNGQLSAQQNGDMSPLKYIQASQSSIQTIEPFMVTQSKLSQVTSKDVSAQKMTPSDGSQRRSQVESSEAAAEQNYSTSSSKPQHAVMSDGRIIVTGDDILIEYVRRIMTLIKQCHQNGIEVSGPVIRKLELFICHKIWQPKEERNRPQQSPPANGMANSTSSGAIGSQMANLPMWQRIEKRFFEMGERKRRLYIKKNQAQQVNQSQEARKAFSESLEKQFRAQEKQKADIVKDFSSNELELMLMQSNKNNPIEVVTLLLTLNPALIGGTPSTTATSLIYNNVSAQGGYGGVLTKLEQEAAAKVRANDGSAVNHHIISNEKSFDSNYHKSKNQGQNVRSSDDTHSSLGLPQSSQSSKKEQFNTTMGSQNLESLKQTQYNSKDHGNGSNPNLMNNFANATIGIGNMKTAVAKGKNQSSFDRSDIAMQTGLTLTTSTHQNKLGSILLQNQQQQQNVKFPQIHNNNTTQMVSSAAASTPGFNYHSNNSAIHGYSTNGSHASVSGPAQTGTSSYPLSFVPNQTSQKPMGIHSYLASQHHSINQAMGPGMIKSNTTTIGMGASSVLAGGSNAAGIGPNNININNNHGDGGALTTTTSKYRVNKIQQHAVSMSPGGASGSSQYMLNKNLRTTSNTDHLNNIGNSGNQATVAAIGGGASSSSAKNEIVMIKGPAGTSSMTSAVSLNSMLKGATQQQS